MADFDPLKAAHDELVTLGDVLTTMRQRERRAEEAMAMAESELNAIRKLRGYCQIEIERARRRVAQLEDKSNA